MVPSSQHEFNLIKGPQRNDFISEQEGSPLTPVSFLPPVNPRMTSESVLNITNAWTKVNMGQSCRNTTTIINPFSHPVLNVGAAANTTKALF